MSNRYRVTRWICADRQIAKKWCSLRPRWLLFDTHLAQWHDVMWTTKAQATAIARRANQGEIDKCTRANDPDDSTAG